MNIDQEALDFAQTFGLDAFQHGALSQLLKLVYKQGKQDGIQWLLQKEEHVLSGANANNQSAGSPAQIFRLGASAENTTQPQPSY